MGGFSFHDKGVNNEAPTQTVRVVNVLEVMHSLGVRFINMMKIDTEGCEFEILDTLQAEGVLPAFIMGEAHGIKDFEMFDMLDKTHHLGINKPFGIRNYEFYAARKT